MMNLLAFNQSEDPDDQGSLEHIPRTYTVAKHAQHNALAVFLTQ